MGKEVIILAGGLGTRLRSVVRLRLQGNLFCGIC